MTVIFSFFKRNKRTILAFVVIIVLVLLARRFFFSSGTGNAQILTQPVLRGDVQQTVQAVGTIESDENLSLRFQASGIVDHISVQEGQAVRKGQTLATLKAPDIVASITSAKTQVASKRVALDKTRAGSRPEEITVSEANVTMKSASLAASKISLESAQHDVQTAKDKVDILQRQATTGVSGDVSTVTSTLNQQLVAAQDALSVASDILNKNDFSDALVKGNASAQQSISAALSVNKQSVLVTLTSVSKATDFDKAIALFPQVRTTISDASNVLSTLIEALSTTAESQYFTPSNRAEYKNTLSSQRSSLQSALTTIESQLKSLQSSPLDYDSQIIAAKASVRSAEDQEKKAESDVATAEASLNSEKANLALTMAGTDPSDIRSAEIAVEQSQADLAKTEAQYSQYVITTPVDGVITNVNAKVGETAPSSSVISILGDAPLYVQMNVAEVDMPNLVRGQTGSIIVNAFSDLTYSLIVAQNDPVSTIVNGANRYAVTLHFAVPHPELKVGMSGNVTIITAIRHNVLIAPERAILADATGGAYVIVQDGDHYYRQRVVTGLRGSSGDTEIISGLSGHETLVLNTDDATVQTLLQKSSGVSSSPASPEGWQQSGTSVTSFTQR